MLLPLFLFLHALNAVAIPVSLDALSSSYDFIVVGGGTCGLVVANRLSEVASASVLVIEAGDSVFNNSDVTDTGGYGRALGTAIDWQYKTTSQTYGGNKVLTLSAGKAIGGTSTINGMAYTRTQKAQIDAWEAMGNTGWNWNNLYPYYLKSEQFEIPTTQQKAGGASYTASFHGYTGPLKVGYTNEMATDKLASTYNQTLQNVGIPYSPDVNGGDLRGFSVYPRTVDDSLDVREDAARAYYWPFTSRQNLHMLAKTTVTQILWAAGGSSSNATASGVKVTGSDGTVQTVSANKEVILAAGSLRSPSLLELSGVGNPSILSKYSISIKVNLPGVGENLQDQMNNGITYSGSSSTTYTGQRGYAAYPNVTDVFGSSESSVASSVLSALPSYASKVSSTNNGASKASDLQSRFQIQYDLLFKSKVPVAELIFYPLGSSLSSQYWALLPFARGNVHIASSDPLTPAAINPNYFMQDWDAKSQVYGARFLRRLFATAPLKNLVSTETSPGFATVPSTASDVTWTSWLKSKYRPNYHPLSTNSMLPREVGGVVNNRLLVYGTSNVRVVDASVIPMQLCGHLMSTLYAVAERGSDLIKADNLLSSGKKLP